MQGTGSPLVVSLTAAHAHRGRGRRQQSAATNQRSLGAPPGNGDGSRWRRRELDEEMVLSARGPTGWLRFPRQPPAAPWPERMERTVARGAGTRRACGLLVLQRREIQRRGQGHGSLGLGGRACGLLLRRGRRGEEGVGGGVLLLQRGRRGEEGVGGGGGVEVAASGRKVGRRNEKDCDFRVRVCIMYIRTYS